MTDLYFRKGEIEQGVAIFKRLFEKKRGLHQLGNSINNSLSPLN